MNCIDEKNIYILWFLMRLLEKCDSVTKSIGQK